MVKWQRDEMDNLIEHFPLNEVIWIHYSVGYSCRERVTVWTLWCSLKSCFTSPSCMACSGIHGMAPNITHRLHKFRDGCAAQYKRRHCIGDITCWLWISSGKKLFRDFSRQRWTGCSWSQCKAERESDSAEKDSSHQESWGHEGFPCRELHNFIICLHICFMHQSSGPGSQAFLLYNNRGWRSRQPDRSFKTMKGIKKVHCLRTTQEQGRVFVRDRSC